MLRVRIIVANSTHGIATSAVRLVRYSTPAQIVWAAPPVGHESATSMPRKNPDWNVASPPAARTPRWSTAMTVAGNRDASPTAAAVTANPIPMPATTITPTTSCVTSLLTSTRA